MAIVYRAYDPNFARDVAIKMLPRELLHDSSFRARFEREARLIAALEHPAIVPVYDYGEQDGQPYIVMRLMGGGSLADMLRAGALPLPEVARILSALAPALDRAHSKGIIHRDLKPSNILFDEDRNPYLADFGIARLALASTMTTGLVGTPAYMSPEQANGEKDLDARSDLYALGVIVFQMLTGQLPYDADTPIGLAMQHVKAPLPRIRDVQSDLPPKIDPLIRRAMAKQRDARYQSATTFATDLAALPTAPRGTRLPRLPRFWLPATVAKTIQVDTQLEGQATNAESTSDAGSAQKIGELPAGTRRWPAFGRRRVLLATVGFVALCVAASSAVIISRLLVRGSILNAPTRTAPTATQLLSVATAPNTLTVATPQPTTVSPTPRPAQSESPTTPTILAAATNSPILSTPTSPYAAASAVSVDLGTTNTERGLTQFDCCDGPTVGTTISGRSARMAVANGLQVHFIYFKVDDHFIFHIKTPVRVTVEYLDVGDFSFHLDYDSTDAKALANGVDKISTQQVQVGNTGNWKTATFDLYDAYFAGRENEGADFRIGIMGNQILYVATVTLTKLPTTYRARIQLVTTSDWTTLNFVSGGYWTQPQLASVSAGQVHADIEDGYRFILTQPIANANLSRSVQMTWDLLLTGLDPTINLVLEIDRGNLGGTTVTISNYTGLAPVAVKTFRWSGIAGNARNSTQMVISGSSLLGQVP